MDFGVWTQTLVSGFILKKFSGQDFSSFFKGVLGDLFSPLRQSWFWSSRPERIWDWKDELIL